MSNVIEFPERGKSLRDLVGTHKRVRFGSGRKEHPALYYHVVHNNPKHGEIEGVILETICKVVLAFIPFDESLIEDCAPYFDAIDYKESSGGIVCFRCFNFAHSVSPTPKVGNTRPKKSSNDIEVARMKRAREQFLDVVAEQFGVTRAEMHRRGIMEYKKDGKTLFTLGR